MLTISAGVIASLTVGTTLDRLDVPGFDTLLQWPLFAIAFTAFAVGGVANAMNIIDGYNGLVAGYAVLVLAALAWVSAQVGDPVIVTASLSMLGALLGFILWNTARGRIFLGDGGAYLVGFWLAQIAMRRYRVLDIGRLMGVQRNRGAGDGADWFLCQIISNPYGDRAASHTVI